MPVPDYESLMLPLLKMSGDGKEHRFRDAIETLAGQLGLNEDERKELLPSGVQAKFDNRVGWALSFLKKAKLLESTGRGKFRITQRGLEVLRSAPAEINAKFLNQFPEFIDFRKGRSQSGEQKNKVKTRTNQDSCMKHEKILFHGNPR